MRTVAVAIVCKTPLAGQSKTRLSPSLSPDQCAAISACFISDMARSVGQLAAAGDVTPYALYSPASSEPVLRSLLPKNFRLHLQCADDFGSRLHRGATELLQAGHDACILVNADSPTLPLSILRAALAAVRHDDHVVLSPAHDGGYILIGLSKPHARLFADIPWSTDEVYRQTLARAREIGLPTVSVPGWYDVDDQSSLRMLEDELAGRPPAFTVTRGANAPATRTFLRALSGGVYPTGTTCTEVSSLCVPDAKITPPIGATSA